MKISSDLISNLDLDLDLDLERHSIIKEETLNVAYECYY
jgi:hypothetical protein